MTTTQIPSMTVAERLARHVTGLRFDDLPTEVARTIKDVLLHDLAVAIGGSREPESLRAVAFATRTDAPSGGATLIGHADMAIPMDAAFANAVMIRAWRQEDSMPPYGLHPGPVILPAALALGECRQSSGRDVIAAIAAGYDVIATLAPDDQSSWAASNRASSHVYGAFGTAATAARLLELDARGVVTALAYAGNLALMVPVGFANHQYGLVVRNGMTAASLAEAGAPARSDALEGPGGFFDMQVGRPDVQLDGDLEALGRSFPVLNTIYKPHPCTGANLVPFTLVGRILAGACVTGADVATVTVTRTRSLALVPGVDAPGPWSDLFRQVSSVRYGIGCILVDGEVTRARLLTLNDPAATEASERVQIAYHDGDRTYHGVTIRTITGETYEDGGDFSVIPKPDSAEVLAREADRHLGAGRAAEIVQAIEHLEELDSIVELTSLLRPA